MKWPESHYQHKTFTGGMGMVWSVEVQLSAGHWLYYESDETMEAAVQAGQQEVEALKRQGAACPQVLFDPAYRMTKQ